MSSSPLVGRDSELAVLRQALAGPPVLVLVEGEAGIGKSRLLREVISLNASGKPSLVAGCLPFPEPFTLGPMVDAVRQATDRVDRLRLSPLAGALRPLFPEWSADLPPALEAAEDATAARHRLFRALAELLDCLGVGVLALEDAHWADQATLEFLLFLAVRQPYPLSLVVTYRVGDVPEDSLLWRLSSRPDARATRLRLRLEPLDVAGTAVLVSSMLAGEQISDEFAAFVHQRTDGVPLAVEESVRLLLDRADVARRTDGQWVRRHLDDIDVPPTIRDAVLERVGRLSQDAQAVLQAAAVVASPCDEAVLCAVTGLGADEMVSALSTALGSGLLQENASGLVSFRHALACRAVYEAIESPRCRVMHQHAGVVLESATTLPVAQLARHFRRAGDTQRWCRYAEQAANLALTSGDEAAAVALLHDLLANADLPAQLVAHLTHKLPIVLLIGDKRLTSLARTLQAVLDTRMLEPAEEAEIRVQLGRVLGVMEQVEAGRVEMQRAVAHLAHDSVGTAVALLTLGWPRGVTDSVSTHLRWLRRAAGVRGSIAPDARLRFDVDMASALLLLGEEAGWAEAERLPDHASAEWREMDVVRGHMNIGDLAMMWGRDDEATRRLDRAIELADPETYPGMRKKILILRARLDWLTGAWGGLAERVESLAEGDEYLPLASMEAVLVRGLLHAAKGESALAEECFQRVNGDVHRHGGVAGYMEPAAALARLRLADGRVGDALHLSDEPVGILAHKGIWLWSTEIGPARVEALVAAGRVDEAATLVTAIARGLRGRKAPAPQAALAMCRAIVAQARGAHRDAATAFGRAAAAWQSLPRPYDVRLAQERQAHCLLNAERVDDGLALLAEVLRDLSQLGATRDVERVADALRGHGLVVPKPRRSGRRSYGDQLSPRELDVVRLVATGQTNRDIAETLSRSTATVATQLQSAMRKLRVTSRAAVAVRATEAGLIGNADASTRMNESK